MSNIHIMEYARRLPVVNSIDTFRMRDIANQITNLNRSGYGIGLVDIQDSKVPVLRIDSE